MGYRYDIAVRSTHKYAVRACGDVARVIDLPDGGVALVVIDGQGSGPSARAVARGVAARLSEALEAGTSADVAAMAANQALAAERLGQVSVSFDVIRANSAGEIDIARFSTNTLCASRGEMWTEIPGSAGPAGRSAGVSPDVIRFASDEIDAIAIATDGIAGLGTDLTDWLNGDRSAREPDALASVLFDAVMTASDLRPKDDVTVAAMRWRETPADQRVERFNYSREVR